MSQDDQEKENDAEVVEDTVSEDEISFEEEDSEIEEGNLEDRYKSLKKELKKIKQERQEYLTGWQKARAELVNATKRMEDETKERAKFANARLIGDLLMPLDSFSMAMANKEVWEAVDTNWRTGVEYIHSQLTKTLGEYGLEEINPQLGSKTDPYKHEPIEKIDTNQEDQDMTIAEIVQKGYELGGKILRPAKVKVYTLQEVNE